MNPYFRQIELLNHIKSLIEFNIPDIKIEKPTNGTQNLFIDEILKATIYIAKATDNKRKRDKKEEDKKENSINSESDNYNDKNRLIIKLKIINSWCKNKKLKEFNINNFQTIEDFNQDTAQLFIDYLKPLILNLKNEITEKKSEFKKENEKRNRQIEAYKETYKQYLKDNRENNSEVNNSEVNSENTNLTNFSNSTNPTNSTNYVYQLECYLFNLMDSGIETTSFYLTEEEAIKYGELFKSHGGNYSINKIKLNEITLIEVEDKDIYD